MATKPAAPDPLKPGWKRVVVREWNRRGSRERAWGVGCVAAVLAVTLSVFFYEQRPASWDTGALRVQGVRAEGVFRLDERMVEKSTGARFSVDLENTTGRDLKLPQALTVMEATKGTGALHASPLKLERESFIPHHHIATIALENDDLCGEKVAPQTCFDRYFKDERYIVVFEEARKYEVRVGIPALAPPKTADNSTATELR